MAPQGRAEYIIEDVAGCGPFQVVLFLAVDVLIITSVSYNNVIMSFGNYNPGWRCLDNVTGSVSTNETGMVTFPSNVSTKEDDYVIGSCEDYRKCDDVEFDPDTSTVVTQWGLVCDKSWIASIIISVQMLGLLLGSLFGGQLSDRFGRKKTLCISLAVCSVSQLTSTFSTSWVMFIVLNGMAGMTSICSNIMLFLYMSEYMTRKWRAIILSVPIWSFGCILMAITAWLTKDWRKIELVGFSITTVALLPVLIWVPESLRWLEVKNKRAEFIKVSQKVLKMNKKNEPSFDQSILKHDETDDTNTYTILDLFRKGYRAISACIIFLFFSFSLLYYSTSFGAKSLYGNFYFNLFLINAIPFPVLMSSLIAMRVMRRRQFTIMFLSLTAVCAITSLIILLVGGKAVKEFGSTVLICLALATLDSGWSGLIAMNAELYPTVIRGVALGMGSMAARAGGIVAPLLIPEDTSGLYIFMSIVASLTVVCCGVCLKVPETKGKALKETFEEQEANNSTETNPVV